jgi:serine/threonine protein kinase/tetratricopeptide (TPR) repeat protein
VAITGDDPTVAGDVQRDPVEQLAEEFLERRRHGEAASISQYVEAHPALGARIRELFPTLLLMEDLKPASRSGAAAPVPLGPLERLGDFRLLREIGRGGMGVVYEAEQESLGRRVALKVLPAVCVASPTRLQRFLREAQAAARLHHTNIVPVFGVGQQDGVRYYVMQLIAGQGLDVVVSALRAGAAPGEPAADESDLRARQSPAVSGSFSAGEAAQMLLSGPLQDAPSADVPRRDAAGGPAAAAAIPPGPRYWQNVARIGIQVADALEYAHRQGTLHRDIKPANLLMDSRGTVWIADFGLAKLEDLDDLTTSGDMVGTLRYMAPEQFEGQADARSDVYALGLTLYELLVLRPAFGEKDRRRLIRQRTQQEPPRPRKLNPAIPRDLETIVVKATSAQPQQRYATAGQLAADLKAFLDDRPIRARRVTALGRGWRWCRRNRAIASLSGAALGLLLAVAVVASLGYFQANAERLRTRAEHARAEANLRLATKAFEDIFNKIGADPVARPAEQDEDDPWPEPVWEVAVTDKDAVLLESMLKFYDQFAQQNQADVKLQKETARAYRRVGDIRKRLGQYDRAETAYRRAVEMFQALAKGAPDDAECLTSVAAIHNDLGTLCRNTGRAAEAAAGHQQALEVLRGASAKTAAFAETRFELARTYGFLSVMSPRHGMARRDAAGTRHDPHEPSGGRHDAHESPGGRHGSAPAATPAGVASHELRESHESHPSHESHGGRHGLRSWVAEAGQYNRQALEILDQLARESPGNQRYLLATARCQRDRFLISAVAGDKAAAQQANREAIRILEKLVAGAPQNPEFRFELAETYAMPYPRSRDRQGTDSSGENLRRAVQIDSDLASQYPAVPEYRASLARSHVRSAELARAADSPADAEEHLLKGVEIQRGLASDLPTIRAYAFFLARSLDDLAEVQISRQEPAKARASLEEAIARCEKLSPAAQGGPPLSMMLSLQYASLARVLRELGETALADQAAAKAKQTGFHHGPPSFGGRRHNHDSPASGDRPPHASGT